ncbi:MAG: LytTR family DNA-binding domain-containing protein [Bacteroidota bacterium]
MPFPNISFQAANKNLTWVLLVGIGLGVASYGMGHWPSLGQSLVQQILISLTVGYSLFVVAENHSNWSVNLTSPHLQSGFLVLLFIFVGLLGEVVMRLVRSFLFQQEAFQLLGGGGSYLFNVILSIILGYGTHTFLKASKSTAQPIPAPQVAFDTTITPSVQSIPVKQGESIVLYPTDTVTHFEAYDNYSFLYDLEGNRHLCNYSLRYLQDKLPDNFLRVHRKYIVNKDQIKRIQPHLKGRYHIQLHSKNNSSITSSNGYADVIKSLIKL